MPMMNKAAMPSSNVPEPEPPSPVVGSVLGAVVAAGAAAVAAGAVVAAAALVAAGAAVAAGAVVAAAVGCGGRSRRLGSGLEHRCINVACACVRHQHQAKDQQRGDERPDHGYFSHGFLLYSQWSPVSHIDIGVTRHITEQDLCRCRKPIGGFNPSRIQLASQIRVTEGASQC